MILAQEPRHLRMRPRTSLLLKNPMRSQHAQHAIQRTGVAAGGFRESFRSLWRVADVIGDSELGYDIKAARNQKCIGELHQVHGCGARRGAGFLCCGSDCCGHKGLLSWGEPDYATTRRYQQNRLRRSGWLQLLTRCRRARYVAPFQEKRWQ